MKKLFTAGGLLLFMLAGMPGILHAQNKIIKVDLNQDGRKDEEVNQPGFHSWHIHPGQADSMVFQGIKIKLVKVGKVGTLLVTDWYKKGMDDPYYARLVSDGVTVENGESGGTIAMYISGLTPGKHTLLTFHNQVRSPEDHTFSPIDIYVDGKLEVHNLDPTDRVTDNADATTAYLHLNVQKGKAVEVLFVPNTNANASDRNVIINGFEINTPDLAEQAKYPFPADRDRHIEAQDNSLNLSWKPSPDARSQDVYFGTDSAAVANADHQSPLFKGNQKNATFKADHLYSMTTYYWRVDEVSAHATTKGNIWCFRPAHLAFPGAQGYGRYAIGGRGGKVVEVTNLEDSGPGSLRAAVTKDIGPRTIVFDVSGLITLKSRLNLMQPYITIAGQTAPGKGICIRGATLGCWGNDDVIRFIRVRLGKPNVSYGGMGLTGVNYSIVDHCSISWTMDEAFSSREAKNITLQRTLISEALNVAGHHNYPPGKAHGFAASIGGDIGSFHHNLLADNYGRNWSLAGGVNGDGQYTGRLDIRDNVVYNWGTRATDGGAKEVNFVNNYYKPGPGTTFFYAFNAQHEGYGGGMQRCYFSGNVMPGVFNEKNEDKGREATDHPVSYKTFVDSPFFPSYVTTQTAEDAYKNVLSNVGCNEPMLDDHDIRIINETLKGTYSVTGSVSGLKGFPDNQKDAGGYENYPEIHRSKNWDSDDDGLPDWWEEIHGTNPHSPKGDFSDADADKDKDGYTNLDDYLAWMATPHYCSPFGKKIMIDLKTLSRGYIDHPFYTVDHVINGHIKIQSGIVLFTPDKKGLASFTFTVKDDDGDSMTRKVNILSGYDVNLK